MFHMSSSASRLSNGWVSLSTAVLLPSSTTLQSNLTNALQQRAGKETEMYHAYDNYDLWRLSHIDCWWMGASNVYLFIHSFIHGWQGESGGEGDLGN